MIDTLTPTAPLTMVDRMRQHIEGWQTVQDRRAIFLECYSMMTGNMLEALDRGEFEDPVWVRDLLNHFADYYFNALTAYDAQAKDTPTIWRMTFDSRGRTGVHVLQHLILGVNAHINYDLVFVIYDILHADWSSIDPKTAESRYRDHCHVNQIIFDTIDCVQREVVARYSPQMDLIDRVLLRLDEWLLERLIWRWREQVWRDAVQLMACAEPEAPQVRQQVEARAVRRGRAILFESGLLGLRHIF